jgi:hypothetical protein
MEFYATRFLNNLPPEIRWILLYSLALGDVGLLAGPPGVGKGWLIYQLLVHYCAGLDFLDWKIGIDTLRRALYLTAEESPAIVHRRTRAALLSLPQEFRNTAATGLHCISVSGPVSLVTMDQNGRVVPSENFYHLVELLENLLPQIIVLDTFARFFPVNENDNVALTVAFSLLESLAREYKTTILVTHHCSKVGSSFSDSAKEVASNLSLQGIRGGTGFTGCARWAAMLTPLTAEYAEKLFGPEAHGMPAGCYVAGRTVKKNEGKGEDTFFLRHGEGGLFEQVIPSNQGSNLSDAELLTREVRRREEAKEPPLSQSKGAREVFGWGSDRSQKATSQALMDGLLTVERKEGGKGNILVTKSPGI